MGNADPGGACKQGAPWHGLGQEQHRGTPVFALRLE